MVETTHTAEVMVRVDAVTAPDVLQDMQSYEKVKDGYKMTLRRTGKAEREVGALDDRGLPKAFTLKLVSLTEKVSKEKGETTKFEDSPTVTGTMDRYKATTFTGLEAKGRNKKEDQEALNEVLQQMSLGMDLYDFDTVYGTREKKAPGDLWAIDRHSLMEVLSTGKWKPERVDDIEGEVKFVKVMTINSKPCAIVEAVTKIKNVQTGLVLGEKAAEIDKAEMVMTVRVALPMDMSVPGRVLSSQIKAHLDLKAEEGRNAVSVDLLELRGEDRVRGLPAAGTESEKKGNVPATKPPATKLPTGKMR